MCAPTHPHIHTRPSDSECIVNECRRTKFVAKRTICKGCGIACTCITWCKHNSMHTSPVARPSWHVPVYVVMHLHKHSPQWSEHHAPPIKVAMYHIRTNCTHLLTVDGYDCTSNERTVRLQSITIRTHDKSRKY